MSTPSLVATSAVLQTDDSSTMNMSSSKFIAWSRMDFTDKNRAQPQHVQKIQSVTVEGNRRWTPARSFHKTD